MSYRYMQPLRIFVQLAFLVFMLYLGAKFYLFVESVGTSNLGKFADRPDAIEGFLPISGLLGAASWLKGGGINTIHPAAVVIFLTVILVSLFLRRAFCSWICPIATVSELAWKIGFRLTRRNQRLPYLLDVILRSVKYLLLIFFIYSITIAMSPDSMAAFIQSDYHKLADVRLLDFFLHLSQPALIVISILVVLSVLLKNPLCRYLCPYGALLGLFAMLSPVRVTRDSERCVSCGACSQVCPSRIDVMHKKSVNSPECIGCWRCVSYCRFNEALSVKIAGRTRLSGLVFASLLVLLFWSGSFIGKLSGNWHTSISIEEYVRLLGK